MEHIDDEWSSKYFFNLSKLESIQNGYKKIFEIIKTLLDYNISMPNQDKLLERVITILADLQAYKKVIDALIGAGNEIIRSQKSNKSN